MVDGNLLRRSPERVLRAYCEAVEIEFDPCMLRWEEGSVRKWGEHEDGCQGRWHSTLDRTTGFLLPEESPTDDVTSLSPDEMRMIKHAYDIYHTLLPYAVR